MSCLFLLCLHEQGRQHLPLCHHVGAALHPEALSKKPNLHTLPLFQGALSCIHGECHCEDVAVGNLSLTCMHMYGVVMDMAFFVKGLLLAIFSTGTVDLEWFVQMAVDKLQNCEW